MAKVWKKRYISTKFWDDNYIVNLDPTEKLLFLYFLSNPLTNVAWIYEISIRRIAFDTGIDKDMVLKIIDRFSKKNKIHYIEWFIIIENSHKHQTTENKFIKKWIEDVLSQLPKVILDKLNKSWGLLRTPTEPLSNLDTNLDTNLDLDIDSNLDSNNLLSKDNKEFSKKAIEEDNNSLAIINKKKKKNEILNFLEKIKKRITNKWFLYNNSKYEYARAKNILYNKPFGDFADTAKKTREEAAFAVIDQSMKYSFWRWQINSAEMIYKHYTKIYNLAIQDKLKNTTITL